MCCHIADVVDGVYLAIPTNRYLCFDCASFCYTVTVSFVVFVDAAPLSDNGGDGKFNFATVDRHPLLVRRWCRVHVLFDSGSRLKV